MIGITNDEAKAELSSMGLRCAEKHLSFPDATRSTIQVALRGMQEPHQLVYLARLLAHLTYDEIHFSSARLWITTWGVWDQLEEAIAFKTFENFRRCYGENRSIEAAPGTSFRHDQFIESVCCLLQPMLIGWDAYYIPTWAYGHLDYFIAISHDGFADIEVRTPDMHEQVTKLLADYEWIKPLIR